MPEGERNLEALARLDAAFKAADFATIRDALMVGEVNPAEMIERAGELGSWTLELVDPEIEIDLRQMSGAFGFPEGREKFLGLQGWMDFWRTWLEPWADFDYEIRNPETVGSYVVREAHITLRGRGSGAPAEFPHVQLWGFRNGKVFRLAAFATREQARRWIEEQGDEVFR